MKKLFALVVVIVVAIGLVGCEKDDHDDDDKSTLIQTISPSEAKELVLKDAGVNKSKVVYYSFVRDGDEYDITFYTIDTEYEYTVSVKSKDITERKHKNHEDNRNPHGTRTMSEDELKKIAFDKAKVKESDITNYQYEVDDDSNTAEIDFDFENKEYSIEIDRSSGNIIEYDIDLYD